MKSGKSGSQTERFRDEALKESYLQHQIQSRVDVNLLWETLAGRERKSFSRSEKRRKASTPGATFTFFSCR